MKTTITIATILFLAACSLNAQVSLTGWSQFAPLPQLQGRPGRPVTLKASLYEGTFDASTRRYGWQPLPGASVGFYVNPRTALGGMLPVGNLVTTHANGSASTRYRIPRKHPHPTNIPYEAYFAGDPSHRGTSRIGTLRVK